MTTDKQTKTLNTSSGAESPGSVAVAALLISTAAAALAALVSCAHVAKESPAREDAAPLATWTELGPDCTLLVRTIVHSASCPKLQVDDVEAKMTLRAPRTGDFPETMCEASVPPSAKRVRLNNNDLPLRAEDPEKILVIGDTGCRVNRNKYGYKIQACNDPAAWPLAQISQIASRMRPDLIVHVGDYHYREVDCPADRPGCAGSPSGDRWPSWQADFFTPTQPLLAAAPWVFARGNHELCARGGQGWFRFLDPRPFGEPCADRTEPYAVALKDFNIFVIDSADDANIEPSLKTLAASDSGKPTWVLTHRPFLTPAADDEAKAVVTTPKPLLNPQTMPLVLVGHVHAFSANQFGDARPPEIISGNGGDYLEVGKLAFESNPDVKATIYRDFGFMLLEKNGPQAWKLTEHDRQGRIVKTCDLRLSERPGLKCRD